MLPYVDEHAIVVDRGAEEVWAAVVEAADRRFSGDLAVRYARLVGCAEPAPSGPRPLTEGSTITGFRVESATPGSELVLRGSHRFSSYTLTFRIDPLVSGGVCLRAETRAAFPGPAGLLYRLFVIQSRGHAVLMRRMLAGIAERAGAVQV